MSDTPREPIMQFFKFEHLPEKLQTVSKPFGELAEVIHQLPRNAERSVALRKLLEAKDAAVRAGPVLALMLFLLPASALAQAAAVAPPAPDAAPWWAGLAQAGVGLLGTVLTVVLGLAGSALRAWAKDKAFGTLVDSLSLKVEAIVRHAEAELRPAIQAALADGKLDDDEKKALKSKVMDLVRLHAQDELKGLAKFGFVGSMLEPILSGLVEKAVAGLGASVPGTTAPIEKLS